jgi:DNA polymerase III alpha subunit
VPRIDKRLFKKIEDIVLSGSLWIPNKILNLGENQAEEALLWWKEEFKKTYIGGDASQSREKQVNTTLISLARKHEVKIVATNTFYIDKEMPMHTIFCFVCVKVKNKRHQVVVVAIVLVCLIRNTISRQGRR